MDLARTRLALDFSKVKEERTYKGFFNCAKKTIKNEGFFSLYKGFVISIIGTLPYVGISLACYDTLKTFVITASPQENENQEQWTIQNMIRYIGIGTISGIFAQVLTYPIDTIRRRKQLDGALGTPKLYKSSFDMLSKMVKTEGIRALYAGLTPSLLKVVPAFAIQFACYDILKSKMHH